MCAAPTLRSLDAHDDSRYDVVQPTLLPWQKTGAAQRLAVAPVAFSVPDRWQGRSRPACMQKCLGASENLRAHGRTCGCGPRGSIDAVVAPHQDGRNAAGYLRYLRAPDRSGAELPDPAEGRLLHAGTQDAKDAGGACQALRGVQVRKGVVLRWPDVEQSLSPSVASQFRNCAVAASMAFFGSRPARFVNGNRGGALLTPDCAAYRIFFSTRVRSNPRTALSA